MTVPPQPGSLFISPDGLTVQFLPSQPFPAGATVIVRLSQQDQTFTNAHAAGPQLQITRISPTGNVVVPPDEVIDVEFASDPPLGANLISLAGMQTIPTTESKPRANVLRLTPVSQLQPGSTYRIVAATEVDASYLGYAPQTVLNVGVVSSDPVTAVAGPLSGDTSVPLNASIRIGFTQPVNQTSIQSTTIVAGVNGHPVVTQSKFTSNYQGLVLTPSAPWPANSKVDVMLEGLEDLRGHPVPAQSWSFQTGDSLDWTAPVQIAVSNLGSGTSTFSRTPAVQWLFDKEMDPSTLFGLQPLQGTGGAQYPRVTSLSVGNRAITITTSKPLPEGVSFLFSPISVSDLSGNNTPVSDQRGTVGFTLETTLPNLLGISPADGQANVPLNAQVFVAFDKVISPPASTYRSTIWNDVSPPLNCALRR